jgi:hypothetical protein
MCSIDGVISARNLTPGLPPFRTFRWLRMAFGGPIAGGG